MSKLSLRKHGALVVCALLVAPPVALPYGVTTHRAISANAYFAAANISSNFFNALQVGAQAILGTRTAKH
jgi:hypothetical protein